MQPPGARGKSSGNAQPWLRGGSLLKANMATSGIGQEIFNDY
jgi:hypothetical protein